MTFLVSSLRLRRGVRHGHGAVRGAREGAPRPIADEERVSFSNVLAFENFLLLMLVIFALQVVDRSFGPVLLLHLTQLGYAAGRAALLVGGLFSALALSGVVGHPARGGAAEADDRPRGDRRGACSPRRPRWRSFALVESAWLLLVAIAVVRRWPPARR